MAITSTLTANGYEVELQPKLGATAKWTPAGTGLIDPVSGETDWPFGNRMVTIGVGGNYATIADAVAGVGSRWVTSKSMANGYTGPWPDKSSFVATFTNGSASFSYVSGTNFTGAAGLVGQEFIKIGTKYYRVKNCDSTTTGTLFGPFQGVTGNYECTPLLLDWMTLMLLPGAHGDYGVNLLPGMILAGLHKESTSLVEDGSGNAFAFAPMTKMVNLSLEPNILFGSMDRLAYDDAFATGDLYPFGCEVRIDKAKVVNANDRGPHAGGNIAWPVVSGGLFAFTNSELVFGNNVGAIGNSPSTEPARILFQNVETSWYKGYGNPLALSVIRDDYNALAGPLTIDVVNSFTNLDDFGFNPTSGPITVFTITDANTTLNIIGGKHAVANNNASASATEYPAAVYCSGGTVNIEGGAVLEGTGSTTSGANQGRAVQVAGGTVNVRAGCRLFGDTDGLVCASGTANISPNADVINGTSGAGTINATAT